MSKLCEFSLVSTYKYSCCDNPIYNRCPQICTFFFKEIDITDFKLFSITNFLHRVLKEGRQRWKLSAFFYYGKVELFSVCLVHLCSGKGSWFCSSDYDCQPHPSPPPPLPLPPLPSLPKLDYSQTSTNRTAVLTLTWIGQI